MSIEDEVRIVADMIWSYWKQLGIAKPKMTWIEVYQLCRYFLEECKKRGIDPQEIDLKSEIDAMISFEENKDHLREVLRVRPSPEEALEEQLMRLASGTEFRVIREERLDELLKYESQVEQLERKAKELKAAREAERARMEDEIRRLRVELEKAKPVKIRFLKDYLLFKKGMVVETRDFPWVLELIRQGTAEMVPIEVPVGAPPPAPPPALPPEERPLRELPEQIRALSEELEREAYGMFITAGLPHEEWLKHRGTVVSQIKSAIDMFGSAKKLEAEEKVRENVAKFVSELIERVKMPTPTVVPPAVVPTVPMVFPPAVEIVYAPREKPLSKEELKTLQEEILGMPYDKAVDEYLKAIAEGRTADVEAWKKKFAESSEAVKLKRRVVK